MHWRAGLAGEKGGYRGDEVQDGWNCHQLGIGMRVTNSSIVNQTDAPRRTAQ